jgi:hypothetical protein
LEETMRQTVRTLTLVLAWTWLLALAGCEVGEDSQGYGHGTGDAADATGGDDVAVNEVSPDGGGGYVDVWTDGGGAPDAADTSDADDGGSPDLPPDAYDADAYDVDGEDAPDVWPDVDDVDGEDAPDVWPDVDDVDGGDAPDVPPDGTCTAPAYSSDCSKVPYFECGWEAYCEGGVIEAFWHEHVFCDGVEEIVEYSCTLDCLESCPAEDYIEWPESGAALADIYCEEAPPCEAPDYSSDCAEVGYFQCGFMATCEDGVVQAEWHEHVFCEGQEVEEIVNYSCATACPDACKPGEIYDWPEDGDGLIEAYCQ